MSKYKNDKIMILVILILTIFVFAYTEKISAEETFTERAERIIDYYASNPTRVPYDKSKEDDPTGYVKSAIYTALARFAAGEIDDGDELAYELFTNPHGGAMFLVMAGMDLYARFHEDMSEETKQAARNFVTGYSTDNLGGTSGTENHRIMFAAGGYLAAQHWPDWNRADEVKEKARGHIFNFVDSLREDGLTEHGSPVYHVFFVNSLLSLYDNAEDEEVRKRAKMGLDILTTHLAAGWVNGNWGTSTLRAYKLFYDPYGTYLSGLTGWLYFGGIKPPQNDGCGVMSAVSNYRVPSIIKEMGTDRSMPFVTKESHNQLLPNRLVRKYIYMDKEYTMFSHYDGIGNVGWSDQLLRWGISWTAEAPGSQFLIKRKATSSADNWVRENVRGDDGSNQVLQHERALVGVYRGPLIGFYPDTEAIEEMFIYNNWIFIHGGTVLIGVKVLKGFEKNRTVSLDTRYNTITSNEDNNAIIVQTADPSDFPGETVIEQLENFAEEVKELPVETNGVFERHSPITVKFSSLSGDELIIQYGSDHYINGERVDYGGWPLLENPWVKADVGGNTVVYEDERGNIVYDFEEYKIEKNVPLNYSRNKKVRASHKGDEWSSDPRAVVDGNVQIEIIEDDKPLPKIITRKRMEELIFANITDEDIDFIRDYYILLSLEEKEKVEDDLVQLANINKEEVFGDYRINIYEEGKDRSSILYRVFRTIRSNQLTSIKNTPVFLIKEEMPLFIRNELKEIFNNAGYNIKEATDDYITHFGVNSWFIKEEPYGVTLDIDLEDNYEIDSIKIYSGFSWGEEVISDFKLQYRDKGRWKDIPGGEISGNNDPEILIKFNEEVISNKVRFKSMNEKSFRIRELKIMATPTI